ncbi:hypothetical protein D7Z26_08945 [Cohnella endophytica]|uniref:Uncharacterized protein n=1 Tax=Cohnella endophytica TaxID=2419778 RepID=A0A494XZB2_9BACL|nr:hypothetical protein [Cohnella endophytica]RKP55319.1 hypothetical protein D7Z26_08945 [Cohnella endophytica]
MREAVLLFIWLVGLFGLIGGVLVAVARFVKKDSMNYDKRFTWAAFSLWGNSRNENTTNTPGQDE